MKKILSFLLLVLCFNSCSNQRFVLNKNHEMAKQISYSEEKIFSNWGISEEQVMYNPAKYCAKGQVLAKIDFRQTNYILELFTLGYLQQRVIDVYCIDKDIK
jgi:hypothetical protein